MYIYLIAKKMNFWKWLFLDFFVIWRSIVSFPSKHWYSEPVQIMAWTVAPQKVRVIAIYCIAEALQQTAFQEIQNFKSFSRNLNWTRRKEKMFIKVWTFYPWNF